MKSKLIMFLAALLLFSCSKEEKFSEPEFENINTVPALSNKDVLLIHNNKLNNSNGTEGMEYDAETGDIVISKQASEDVGYILKEMQILSVDMDTTAILRQITRIDTIDDNILLKTTDADLEDVFRDAEFELVSDFDPDIKLKSSASNEDISNALCDGKVIRPARIIYNTPDGRFVESVFDDEKIKGGSMLKGERSKYINFLYNMKNVNIYNYDSNNLKASLTLEEGRVSLGSGFVLATSIRRCKLKAFRFEVKPSASVDAKFKLHASGRYHKAGAKKIKNNAYSRTFIYYLGGFIVLSVKIDVDIWAGYDFQANSSLTATSGCYASVWADLGARWTKKGWTPIRKFGHSQGVYPMAYSTNSEADLRVELFPRTTAYICGVNGVSMDVVPYIKNQIGIYTDQLYVSSWCSVKYGLDARINARVKIAKKNLASYSSGNIQIVPPQTLWSAEK